MDYRKYAPWEHYPKTLSHREMMEPLSVVEDFFSCDSVKGHVKRLKGWRHYAINNQYFNDERGGPGPLLFIYDLNLKLLEAVYLLYCDYQNYGFRRKRISDEQLQDEIEKWEYFPKDLSRKEILEPYRAVKKVFKDMEPQQYRDCLHEWLHSALYNKPDFDGLNANDIVTVYENLRKLYAAAWLINQRDGERPRLKRGVQTNDETMAVNIQVEIKPIAPVLSYAEKLGLEEIVKLITKRFPAVQMIVHLGIHSNPLTYFLLILINDEDNTPEHEVSNKIEDHCQYLAKVHAIVHKTGSLKDGLINGKRFWVTAIEQGLTVYQTPELVLPRHEPVTREVVIVRAKFNWERWGLQGKAFLDGAWFYMERQEFRLAAFLLHQSVESTLKAIVQVVIGYRVQIHNLSRLLRLSLLFTDDLKKVFELGTVEGVQLFTLLQNAYAHSRYKSSFEADGESVNALAKIVTQFCQVAEMIYRQFIEKD